MEQKRPLQRLMGIDYLEPAAVDMQGESDSQSLM
jgi:hypothetical protein